MSRFKKSFALLKAVGLEINDFNTRLTIPPKDCEYVGSFFNTLPVKFKRPLIAIHPGTSPKTLNKRWMPDRYAQLADYWFATSMRRSSSHGAQASLNR